MKKQLILLSLGVAWGGLTQDTVWAKKAPKAASQEARVEKEVPTDHPFYRALMNTYNTNPTLQVKVREQYAKAENVSQALAGWRPSLSLDGSASRSGQEDQISKTAFFGGPISPRSYSTNYGAALKMSQNLFAGGSTVAGIDAARATMAAGIADFTKTEQDTLFDAVRAYVTLYFKRSLLELKQKNVAVKKKTLDQSRARMEVGEQTLTDVSQAEGEFASALASEIVAKAELDVARETYQKIVGESAPETLPLPELITQIRPLPQTQGAFVDVCVKSNPLVVNARLSQEAARASTDVARGSLLPSVGLEGSLRRNLTSDTVNTTDARVNSASVGVTVSIPLYGSGGADWSRFRQARQQATGAKIKMREVERAIKEDATTQWDKFYALKDQIPHLETQVEAARLSLEGVQQESLVGERTLLDVLSAENTLLNAETNLLQTRTDYLTTSFAMLSSMGQLTAAGLNLPVTPYPIQAHAHAIENTYIGIGDEPER